MNKLFYFLAVFPCFLSMSTYLFPLNLDDNRVNPFEGIEDYEGVVYVKIGNSVCSGALINHRTILTAAHCLIEGKEVEIFLGEIINEDETGIKTTSFIKLPEDKRYSTFNGASYDLALISLKDPLLEITPIKLNLFLPNISDEVYISGFGLNGTGTNPDQDFDKKKRWGKNTISIIADESSINGSSLSSSPDKKIIGINFDKNKGQLESMISLGDSGSPLLIKENNQLSIVGVASWIKKNASTLNRGYGASAGFSSIQQNQKWLEDNNPLRSITSVLDGNWSIDSNWNDQLFPSNQYPGIENYNTLSAKYYSVDVSHVIDLNRNIQIDSLKISENGHLRLTNNSSLEVLIDIHAEQGNLDNEGTLEGRNLFLNQASFINRNEVLISENILTKDTLMVNTGEISANRIELDQGTLMGTGVFVSNEFWNKGKIKPGLEDNIIGTLIFNSNLINEGSIELDLKNNKEGDLIIADELTLKGQLIINPISTFYSANTSYELIKFDKKNESEFEEINISNTNFGRLTNKLNYGDKIISFDLFNPSYEVIGNNKKSKAVGRYIDSFSTETKINFQSILDQINYIAEDGHASKSVESIVLSNIYEPFLERLEINSVNNHSGIFISESKFEINESNLNFESNISRLDINYFGINVSHLDIESDLFTKDINQFSESSAYEVKVNVPFEILDVYFGFYDEEKNTNSKVERYINSVQFTGHHQRSIDIEKQFLVLEKTFNLNLGTFKAGISHSSINISTNPFSENLNTVPITYKLSDIEMNLTNPYLVFSKNFKFGNNVTSLGVELNGTRYSSSNYSTEVNIDEADSNLFLQDELDLNEDISTNLFMSNVYNKSIYGKISFLKKGENEFLKLNIGYLF